MSNVKEVVNCPDCNVKGDVISRHGRIVHRICPKCKNDWTTIVVGKIANARDVGGGSQHAS